MSIKTPDHKLDILERINTDYPDPIEYLMRPTKHPKIVTDHAQTAPNAKQIIRQWHTILDLCHTPIPTVSARPHAPLWKGGVQAYYQAHRVALTPTWYNAQTFLEDNADRFAQVKAQTKNVHTPLHLVNHALPATYATFITSWQVQPTNTYIIPYEPKMCYAEYLVLANHIPLDTLLYYIYSTRPLLPKNARIRQNVFGYALLLGLAPNALAPHTENRALVAQWLAMTRQLSRYFTKHTVTTPTNKLIQDKVLFTPHSATPFHWADKATPAQRSQALTMHDYIAYWYANRPSLMTLLQTQDRA